MSITLTPSQTSLSHVPDGTYRAEFVRAEELGNMKFGDAIRWYFRIIEDPIHEGIILDTLSSQKFGEGSKAFAISTILLEEEPMGSLDLASLMGKKCRIVATTIKSAKGDFSRITEVLPYQEESGEEY